MYFIRLFGFKILHRYPMSRYVIEPVKESPVRRRRSSGSTNAVPRQRYRRRRRQCCRGRRPNKDESTSRDRRDTCESVRHGQSGGGGGDGEPVRQRREVDGSGRSRREVRPPGGHCRRDASETKASRLDDCSGSGKRHQRDGQSESHRRDDDNETERPDPVNGESGPHHRADGEPMEWRGQDSGVSETQRGRNDSESDARSRDGAPRDTAVGAQSFDRISSTARPATSRSSRPSASRHRYRSFSRRLRAGRRRQLDRRPSGAFSRRVTVARTVVAADDDGGGAPAVRCSANVVLLAHGFRSLHVLVVQRSQLTASDVAVGRRGRVRPSPSAVVVRYKL